MSKIPSIKSPSLTYALHEAAKTVNHVEKGLKNQSISVRESLKQLKAAEATLIRSFKAREKPPSEKMQEKMNSILESLTFIHKQARGESKTSQEKVGAMILAFRNVLGKRRKKTDDNARLQRRIIKKTLERGQRTENVGDNPAQLF